MRRIFSKQGLFRFYRTLFRTLYSTYYPVQYVLAVKAYGTLKVGDSALVLALERVVVSHHAAALGAKLLHLQKIPHNIVRTYVVVRP